MRLWPIVLEGKAFVVTQHDDGTFEMPAEIESLKGCNTALKPGQEIWWLARKPLAGTVASNVLTHGTGALNIVGSRVGTGGQLKRAAPRDMGYHGGSDSGAVPATANDQGRWPTNLLLSHSALCVADRACQPDCPVVELDRQSGITASRSGGTTTKALGVMNDDAWVAKELPRTGHDDRGGASRFFPTFRYEAKAPASERPKLADGTAWPTVKPVALMRWLVRLITPPGGLVLDPFAGSGTTGEACIVEGFRCLLIDQDPAAAELIKTRLSKSIQPVLFGEVGA